MLAKGLYTNMLRVMWPHLGAMAGAAARSMMGAVLPRSLQDAYMTHVPPGYRFAGFYNGIMQVRTAPHRAAPAGGGRAAAWGACVGYGWRRRGCS